MKRICKGLLWFVTWPFRAFFPWEYAGGKYLCDFKTNFAELARELSNGWPVRMRYSVAEKCVLLYRPFRDVIARIVVHGECCGPQDVYVTTPRQASARLRTAAERLLRVPQDTGRPKPVELTFFTSPVRYQRGVTA